MICLHIEETGLPVFFYFDVQKWKYFVNGRKI